MFFLKTKLITVACYNPIYSRHHQNLKKLTKHTPVGYGSRPLLLVIFPFLSFIRAISTVSIISAEI